MKNIKIWLLAIAAMLFVVNNSIYGQIGNETIDVTSISNQSTIDFFAGTTPLLKNNTAGSLLVALPSGTANLAKDGTLPINIPGSYGVNTMTLTFFMRCVQNPAEITVTDNGNGTRTISGFNAFFATSPAFGRLYAPSGVLVGSNQTSYSGLTETGVYEWDYSDGVNPLTTVMLIVK